MYLVQTYSPGKKNENHGLLFVFDCPRMNVTKQLEFPGDVCDSAARPFAYGAQNFTLSSMLHKP